MSRAVGVEIGTSAVRAVEVRETAVGPEVVRFGQVALRAGAVRDGEVIDGAAVGEALKQLWADAGFRAKEVVVGIAGPRIMVRQADVPHSNDEDLAAALKFQIQDYFPVATNDAVIDYEVMDRLTAPDGGPVARVLLAAAPPLMVEGYLAALEHAGLRASAVDLIPLALVRALVEPDLGPLGGDPGDEAIVCIGESVTDVVVHENGMVRFVRMLPVGGDRITEGLAGDLHEDLEWVQGLKREARRGAGASADSGSLLTATDRMHPLVEEIRGSLDYFLAQGGSTVRRVAVIGAASRLPGLLDRLQHDVRVPVEAARLRATVRIADLGQAAIDVARAETVLPVPVGLALRGLGEAEHVHRLSLVPPRHTEKRRQKQGMILAAAAVGAVFAGLMLLAGAQAFRVHQAQGREGLAKADGRLLQHRIDTLAPVGAAHADLLHREQDVKSVIAGDVDWAHVVSTVQQAMPADALVSSFQGSRANPGSVNIAGTGSDQNITARWIQGLARVDGLTNLWVPSASKPGGPHQDVTFTSTATLTPAAQSTGRVDQYIGGAR
jgi:type IV pilus assembly protein PilM